jgi:molybdopterin converting factor small subunit
MTKEEPMTRIMQQTKTRGAQWLKELYEYFAPFREEAAKSSEEEINADIDAAVKEVRAKTRSDHAR